jgi:membrane protein YqaA with SNARE-associated domain
VQGVALSLGGPVSSTGLSTPLSFPEVVDLLLIWMTTRHKALMVYYATLSTLGSIAGCFALYLVARKGGETFLRKRFHERHVDRALGAFRKHGLLAVIVPSLLPPPAPFRSSCWRRVADIAPLQFVVAIAIGGRYFPGGLPPSDAERAMRSCRTTPGRCRWPSRSASSCWVWGGQSGSAGAQRGRSDDLRGAHIIKRLAAISVCGT